DPVARAGPEARGVVARVRQLAAVEREAAAADALRQPELEALELGDPLVDPRLPRRGEPRPVAPAGSVVRRELGQLVSDLVEGHAEALGEDDERDPAQHGAWIAPMPGARALRGDETALLVEPQRGRGDAAATGDFADRQDVGHDSKSRVNRT